jgi:hypothetical protein
MFIPVGTDRQSIWVVNKDKSGEVTKEKVMDVRVSLGLAVGMLKRELKLMLSWRASMYL